MAALTSGRSDRCASWAPGPSTPRLAIGEVHVWLANLRSSREPDLSPLTRAERERASRFPQADKGRLWARSRGVLRALLGVYLETDPDAIPLGTDSQGKLFLATPRDGEAISFNLSHSGTLALYAFAPRCRVGVDLELARRPIDDVAVARRAFGPAFAERLRGLDRAAARAELLAAWTRHEAIAKCTGAGIWRRGRQAAEPVLGESDAPRHRPWVAQLDIGAGAFGSVAAQRRPRALACWSWPPETRTASMPPGRRTPDPCG